MIWGIVATGLSFYFLNSCLSEWPGLSSSEMSLPSLTYSFRGPLAAMTGLRPAFLGSFGMMNLLGDLGERKNRALHYKAD